MSGNELAALSDRTKGLAAERDQLVVTQEGHVPSVGVGAGRTERC